MKKFLLTLGACCAIFAMNAQVVFLVEAPSANEGSYANSYAAPGSWGVSDLTLPGSEVTGTLVLVDDGTASDSLGCETLVNAADVNGKIAVLYRGKCKLGEKAKFAQDAGAIAVVIVNNLPGAPVGMGGSEQGPNVTIPVIMITAETGALLRPEIDAAATTAFIGTKEGRDANDLGIYKNHVLRAEQFGNLQELSKSASEFEVKLGAWVYNYGSADQSNVVLNATVTLDGTELYNETSAPVVLLPAVGDDSVFITLPDFTQASYANGTYEVVYSTSSAQTEDFVSDNTVSANFMISDDLFSLGRLDPTTKEPIGDIPARSSANNVESSSCITFIDANASRLGAVGISFSAATEQSPNVTSLEGEAMRVLAYEWKDVFTDVNNPEAVVEDIVEVAQAEYLYSEDLQNQNINVSFDDAFALKDNQRYLFCVEYGGNANLIYDTETNYLVNKTEYKKALTPNSSDGTWNIGGFASGSTGFTYIPAISVNMVAAEQVNLVELPVVELDAYPNPATSLINIPMNNKLSGNVTLSITDINGRIVNTQNTVIESNLLEVDVTTIATGTYVITLASENGETGVVRVMVTR